MHVTAFARCGWCHGLKRPQFYQGKRVARCSCDADYRTPVETRRDGVLEKYGDDPDAYTPAVLMELAKDGVFDISGSFCPAGRLSMAETVAREASGILTEGGDAKQAPGASLSSPARKGTPRDSRSSTSQEGSD